MRPHRGFHDLSAAFSAGVRPDRLKTLPVVADSLGLKVICCVPSHAELHELVGRFRH